MEITMKRIELLEKLNSQLELAKTDDARRLAAHEKQEKSTLEKFRDRARKAAAWDWETLKKNKFEVGIGYSERPSCPTSEAVRIQRIISQVKMDRRPSDTYRFKPDSDIGIAVLWLPENKRPKESLCD